MCIYTFDILLKLSLCLAMHLAMQLLDLQGFLADKDPFVPLYMPIWVARGVNIAQGILLCYIAHSSGSIADFDTVQFYMNHVFSIAMSEIVKRFFLGPIMLLISMTVKNKTKYTYL
jgi:hypothetical protein